MMQSKSLESIIKLTLIQSSVYFVVHHHYISIDSTKITPSNKRHQDSDEPANDRRMPEFIFYLHNSATKYIKTIQTFQVVHILLRLILELFRGDSFATYHFVQCFSFGRYQYSTRTNDINQLLYFTVAMPVFMFRHLLMSYAENRFGTGHSFKIRLHVMEFLLHNRQEVERSQLKCGTSRHDLSF
jgi:hypothetical protein